MATEKIGFIGLGMMGRPMAENLVRKGFDTLVYDIRKEPLEALQKLGARVAGSPGEIGEKSDVIITMVLDTAQSEAVILGKDGALAGARKGSVIIIASTIEPSFCQRAAKAAAAKGVGFIDAPVSGEASRAADGTLTVIVGGEDQLVARCRPILEAIGKNVFHVGGVGTGEFVKLANNIVINASYLSTTEAIIMVTRAGVSMERFLEIARTSTAINWAVLDDHWYDWWKRKLEGGPSPMIVTTKDLHLALEAVKKLGLDFKHLETMATMDIVELLKTVRKEDVEK